MKQFNITCYSSVASNILIIQEHRVTHMGGAPIVMSSLLAHRGPRTWTHRLSELHK